MAFSEHLCDVVLLLAAALCLVLLIATLQHMLFHIVCGILFMACAAYTLVRGQEAPSRSTRLGWFVCTGGVLFLFSIWALQVVFPAPKVPTTVGCGGVKFVTPDEAAGSLRTEL